MREKLPLPLRPGGRYYNGSPVSIFFSLLPFRRFRKVFREIPS